jgi:hypothetical protein
MNENLITYLTENANGTTTVEWEIEGPLMTAKFSGTETELLRHEGNLEIRSSLLEACIARLEQMHNAKRFSFPPEGVELPDEFHNPTGNSGASSGAESL